ncbi:hypothetical protein BC835DRAFT_1420947 [Cytidiella melzeri]|nr:hypothetical protein BC835DRAFT_1420947 [Cytidiella melzeri]
MPPNSVRKHSGKLTGETQKPATGVSPPRPPHPLPEDTGTTPVKVTATAPTKLATKHNTNGKRATQPMSPSSADSGAHTATSGTITKPTTGVSLPPPPHPVAADAVITPVKATATAPINLPAKLAKGKSVASRDEPPSTQPMSPSGVDSGARTATTRSTSSGMRSRKALKKKGSDVSAEGLSLPSEPSHTEPEAPHLTTIPPVSQKKLQPQHKPAPQASPCEDLRATHGSPPSVDTNKVHEPHDVTKSKPPSCPSVPSGPVAERESTASSAHRTYQASVSSTVDAFADLPHL